MRKKSSWLEALAAQKLEVHSAADAMKIKGWLDTGNYALNWAISGRLSRGYPLGHTVEIFGDPSTGKSFLAARALAMAQQQGGRALLDDTEGAYNLEHTAHLGVDIPALAYRTSATVKDHLQTANAFLAAIQEVCPQGPGILVCDSLAQLTTEHELELQLEKPDMSRAKELRAFYRITRGNFLKHPVLHLSTNHLIANIGNMWQPKDTPGGGGPKYTASVRIGLGFPSKIKTAEKDIVGVIVRITVDKNRISAPWRQTTLTIPFNGPISPASGLVPLLVKLGWLEQRGHFLYRGSAMVGRAYADKKHALSQDQVAEQLLDQIPELVEEVDALLAQREAEDPQRLTGEVSDDDEAEDE